VLLGLLISAMLGRAADSGEAAGRDAAMKMSLLHEDLGQVRTVRVFSIESVDNRRFDEHIEDYREADARRLRLDEPWGPGPIVLIGIAAAVSLGMIGFRIIAGSLEPATALTLLAALAAMASSLA